jgi:hypothetical protein
MPEPTTDQFDALVGPATPHFAYQLRAAAEGPKVRRDVPGWEEIPSSAPADEPLPRRR